MKYIEEFTFTPETHYRFMNATGDRNKLHTDDFMKPRGLQPFVHGMHTGLRAVGLSAAKSEIGQIYLQFGKNVRVGESLVFGDNKKDSRVYLGALLDGENVLQGSYWSTKNIRAIQVEDLESVSFEPRLGSLNSFVNSAQALKLSMLASIPKQMLELAYMQGVLELNEVPILSKVCAYFSDFTPAQTSQYQLFYDANREKRTLTSFATVVENESFVSFVELETKIATEKSLLRMLKNL